MRLSLILLALLLSSISYAENKIYTWVDENGITQYGDRPPLNSKAEEVKMKGYQTPQVSVEDAELVGHWQLTNAAGDTQDWQLLENGQVQIDSQKDNDRTIIMGRWELNNSILTIESSSIQQRANGLTSVSTDPVRYVYQFLEFTANRFRVSNNSGMLIADRL